ncbi:MAG: galactose-binding protein [Soonwooa sp.]
MSALVWSLNGKYFKDFGVSVSSSDGLMDKPAQKKTDTYDWPEYNGLVVDTSKKPRYGSREIQLTGWVEGLDWVDMKRKFDALFSEFDKAGKQRLVVDGFGLSSLIFDVICEDKIELLKRFKKGKMIGFFKAKLTEQSPIKKVLSIANPNLQLAFNSPKWIEVNIDGAIESHKGVVNINKTLPNRSLTRYNFGGRNLLLNTDFKENINHWNALGLGELLNWNSSEKAIEIDNGANNNGGTYQTLNQLEKGEYTISFDVKPLFQSGDNYAISSIIGGAEKAVNIHTDNVWKRYSLTINSEAINNYLIIQPINARQRLLFKNIKLEKGNKATDWTPAPEEEHFITIAGNIDEITNLTTNAQVLWEKL